MSDDFRKEVEYVARLSRLTLTSAEKDLMAAQINDFLESVKQVQEIDTTGVEPTSHVISMPARLREDLIQPSLPLNKVLQNAPVREDNFFRVPSITSPTEREDG